MSQQKGLKEVAFFDCPGSGQVYVNGNFAYLGHMDAPAGTTILDVSDPRHPRQIAHIQVPAGVHSHKVRVENNLMVVNWEAPPPYEIPSDFRSGILTYDISNPYKPRQLSFWECGGVGVHKFDFDGKLAYISPTLEGYDGNIVMILDLSNPTRPQEVSRWWLPGQWVAGGEKPTWTGYRQTWCHHPLRLGDRLYTGYWHAGFVILGIEDIKKPRLISRLDWSPPYAHPTHSALPIPFSVRGRRLLVVSDEDVRKLFPSPPPFIWIVDITEETNPIPIATFQIEGIDETPQLDFTGCHQPAEQVYNTEIPVAWFTYGVRVVDIANPYSPKEVAYFVPPVPKGAKRVCSNDVFLTKEGLIYLVDRNGGLYILERT